MKRPGVPTVAFYIGVISLILGFVSRVFIVNFAGVMPHNFIHFANSWFLISIAGYLHEMHKK